MSVLRTLVLNTVHLFACVESVLHYGVQKRKLAVLSFSWNFLMYLINKINTVPLMVFVCCVMCAFKENLSIESTLHKMDFGQRSFYYILHDRVA